MVSKKKDNLCKPMRNEIVIHCPHSYCKKLLAREVLLKPGSHFKIKCYHCGGFVYVNYTTFGRLEIY